MSLRVGITCYPTFGGSGIIATEVGLGLARRGHQVHFICTDLPVRLDPSLQNVAFHPVVPREYPVFPRVPYELALTSAMVAVAEREGLDVLHAHYAVPHATAAWMAREVLGPGGPKVVTTLHGTDITLVGSDPSYLPITRHSIAQSDAVTAPSVYLRDETWQRFGLHGVPIEVIPNFVDPETYHPRFGPRSALATWFGPDALDVPVLLHVSNLRSVKRVDRVVEVFAKVVARRDARLLIVGDGPERPAIEQQLRDLGLTGPARLVGDHVDVPALLREAAVFLLPSATESFGLAALEALASGVPVVASDVGGLPEVVRHGETGFLLPPDDVDGMAAATLSLLDDPAQWARFGQAARADAISRFRPEARIDAYEALFERVLRS